MTMMKRCSGRIIEPEDVDSSRPQSSPHLATASRLLFVVLTDLGSKAASAPQQNNIQQSLFSNQLNTPVGFKLQSSLLTKTSTRIQR